MEAKLWFCLLTPRVWVGRCRVTLVGEPQETTILCPKGLFIIYNCGFQTVFFFFFTPTFQSQPCALFLLKINLTQAITTEPSRGGD